MMAEVSAGQVARLALLFERHHRALFRYFVSMNGDREQAEDLVQEVFFRMLRYRTSYDPAQSFTAWMYQIARNAGVDQVRKRGSVQVVDIDTFVERRAELVSASPGPEESASRGSGSGAVAPRDGPVARRQARNPGAEPVPGNEARGHRRSAGLRSGNRESARVSGDPRAGADLFRSARRKKCHDMRTSQDPNAGRERGGRSGSTSGFL